MSGTEVRLHHLQSRLRHVQSVSCYLTDNGSAEIDIDHVRVFDMEAIVLIIKQNADPLVTHGSRGSAS